MSRLTWDGRNCTNPPEGWEIEIESFPLGWFWKADQVVDSGALYSGAGVATEAQAKRSCEAALLRLGVLEPGEAFVTAARLILDFGGRANDRAVIAIARALAALEVEASDG
jgi:hypothetical protein